MTAAIQDIKTDKVGDENTPPPPLLALPCAANVQIFAGTFAANDTNGRAVPATSAAALFLWGRVERQVNNLTSNSPFGAAGAQNVVVKPGAYYFSSDGTVTTAMIGQPVYALDDNTVTTNPTKTGVTYWLPFAGTVMPPGVGDFGFLPTDSTKIPVWVGYPAPTGDVLHATIDVPLTAINAATSGTAFNIGPALPSNAVIVSSDINLIQVIAGGSVGTSVVAKVQNNAGETAGSLLGGAGGLNVFTGATLGLYAATGSNPYAKRGGQQLQMTITAGAGTLASATTGHLAVDLYYTIAQ